MEAVEALGGVEAKVADVGEEMGLEWALNEEGDALIKALELAGVYEVLVEVPTNGVEDFGGELHAVSEELGEAIELGLADGRDLHAAINDLLYDWEELLQVGYEVVGG